MTHPPRPAARSIEEATRRVSRLSHRGDPCEASYLMREAILRCCEARPDVPELLQLADFVDAYDSIPTLGRHRWDRARALAQPKTPPAAPQPARRTA